MMLDNLFETAFKNGLKREIKGKIFDAVFNKEEQNEVYEMLNDVVSHVSVFEMDDYFDIYPSKMLH